MELFYGLNDYLVAIHNYTNTGEQLWKKKKQQNR